MVGICRRELCREKAPEIRLGFPLGMLETVSGLQNRRENPDRAWESC